jgi:hypothetical protein
VSVHELGAGDLYRDALGAGSMGLLDNDVPSIDLQVRTNTPLPSNYFPNHVWRVKIIIKERP